MTWTYSQTTGTLTHNEHIVGHGYSGYGAGKNNFPMQTVRDAGTIPEGYYTIGSPHRSDHVGNFAMSLTPEPGTRTLGRDAFFLHGDSTRHPGSASNDCIIMDRIIREKVWTSGDRQLKVVP
ncbi:DUF2778 domain-containing protein [Dyella monticola]|uniref:DUF2778 domain-containing protein n=1 Tax=Dyella monticola TaxID=1927958 RepID=A0A370X4L6_9GAMM|nr:tlde1 domain-containing protein [Dyella monticola]RDS83155.1 DUF2778 domain-containing protein [Dyella monticola]